MYNSKNLEAFLLHDDACKISLVCRSCQPHVKGMRPEVNAFHSMHRVLYNVKLSIWNFKTVEIGGICRGECLQRRVLWIEFRSRGEPGLTLLSR